MRLSKLRCFASLLVVSGGLLMFFANGQARKQATAFSPVIPKTWVDEEIAELEIPLATVALSPKHVSAEYYYRIRERKVYKTYPIYAPGKEPAGYFDWLKQQEPEIVFDPAKLKTEADWIAAGELVFENTDGALPVTADSPVRNPAYYEKLGIRLTREGVNPYQRYVIREKGKVELRIFACADCHTRVLDDGTVVKGAQSNFPLTQAGNFDIERRRAQVEANLKTFRNLSQLPWVSWLGEPPSSFEEVVGRASAVPPGVLGRHRANGPMQVPDLIGVKDRKYLDRTGLQLHRGIADLMRYASMNQDTDMLSSFAGFNWGGRPATPLPDPARWRDRFSDPQLYALALYLYSLKPPPNPNKFDALARRGQRVFRSEGCAVCHTPPLYTNNKLTPVDGFTVPEEHKRKYDILPISVGTDPGLALRSLRGTGYYKVPSLKGVWYRGPFEHSGSVATLEDWFDPKRLRDDYVPTGFKAYGVKTRAVKGHEFGLQLSAEDKRALIAFLKTL